MPFKQLYSSHLALASPLLSLVCITNEKHLEASGAIRLERVVLGRNLVVVEVADEGHLLQDVGLHARDAVEEEEGEDAGRGAEGGADGAPARESHC